MSLHNSNQSNGWTKMSFLMLLLLLVLQGPAVLAGIATTTQANGATAQAYVVDSIGNFGTVFVFRNSQADSTTTYLDYFVTTGTTTFLTGSGCIPKSAFQVQGSSDTLSVDTSNITELCDDGTPFKNLSCTLDPSTGFETCTPATGGVINLTWTKLPQDVVFQQSGKTTYGFAPGVTFTSVGTMDADFALASGTLVGAAVTSTFSVIGTNHNAQITITLP
jgi:hypothetical protein